ncbi:ATP-dependent Clp protease adaptor ClpS [bacterium]|nr:MAG: ATP-dependent Clp protease adaptor ClpS [bacterium]
MPTQVQRTGRREITTAGADPCRVLLHNDDVNDMDHVVRALLLVVAGLTPGDAGRIMLEAHREGIALVIVCHRELAELYRDGLRSAGLTATIEAG